MKKFFGKVLLPALVCGALFLSSCAGGSSETAADSGQMSDYGYIFTDSAGRKVDVPSHIERILPSGNLAQTFMWPLASDRLVSLDEAFSPEALLYIGEEYASLPVTGDLYMTGSELNIEEVALLSPDIIVDFGEPKDTIVEDLDRLSEILEVPAVFIEGSFENTADAYRVLGKLLDMEDEAEEIACYVENIMDTAAAVFEETEKKTLIFANSSDGLGVIAKGTYFDEIWSYMGDNVAVTDDRQMYWFSSTDLEQLYIWDPEFIFFYSADTYAEAVSDPAWSDLSAVQNGHLYVVPLEPIDFCFTPSVNRYMGIIWLAEIMYPDEFDYDIREEVYRYYHMFYHLDMTDELYERLMYASHSLPDA